MRIPIKTAYEKGLIKEGRRIRTNGASFRYPKTEGIIGELSADYFYFWQDKDNGSLGNVKPSTKGFKHSWMISSSDTNWIEFLDSNPDISLIRYILLDHYGSLIGIAKDKRQLTTVLKKTDGTFRLFDVKELKTQIKLEEL